MEQMLPLDDIVKQSSHWQCRICRQNDPPNQHSRI